MNQKILIVGPAWVGDMVMAQSLFKLLKAHSPNAIIDVVAPAWSLPLLARMPEVASGIVMPVGHGRLGLKDRFSLGRSLREKQYTEAIVLPNSFKSALVPFFAKVPKRTGWSREMRFLILNDIRFLNKKRYPLMVERYMALGLPANAALPVPFPLPELKISSKSQAESLAKFNIAVPERPILALCPGAEFGPAKRWPEAHFATIANAKLDEGWDVWIFGSPNDKPQANEIMQLTGNRCLDLTGKTRLEEAIDLLALTAHVMSNDSGLMHIAAALHKPLLALYGPTSATFTPPLNKAAKILSLKLPCQPCFQRTCPLEHQNCMRELSPNDALPLLSGDKDASLNH